MCGIAGIVSSGSATVDFSRIVDMADRIAHRGPDGEGLAVFGWHGKVVQSSKIERRVVPPNEERIRAALAHRRLAIIDLSPRGAQPMSDATGRYWITFNGEIYNYIELRQELLQLGCSFASTTDTEVILHAYERYGTDCLQYFNGMFAFAIWDNVEKSLFCARDRLGIKPLYYLHSNGGFYFGSEQKAVLAAFDTRPRANVDAITDYLCFSYVTSTNTMFEGVQSLLAGSFLLLHESKLRIGTYWDPNFDPVRNDRSMPELAAQLRDLLKDSIRMQIRSDVPIGAHLSGGIDSSTVCSLAGKLVPRLQTFTARFDEGTFFDESQFARIVACQIQSEQHEVTPTRMQLNEVLPKIIYTLDEPVEAASIFGKYKVAEIVGQHVKVVLGGQGGDELFGGYDWYIKSLLTALVYGHKLDFVNAGRMAYIARVMRYGSKKRLAKSIVRNVGIKSPCRVFVRNWSRFVDKQLGPLLNVDVRQDIATRAGQKLLEEFDTMHERREIDKIFKYDMRHYLQALLTSEDRLSMCFSVESRVPLLDHRIAEFAGQIGAEHKMYPEYSKLLLREAVRGIVPHEILARRDKRGFPTPIGRWLRDRELGLVENFMYEGNEFANSFFNLSAVRKLQKTRSMFSTDAAERLWRVLTVGIWGDVFKVS